MKKRIFSKAVVLENWITSYADCNAASTIRAVLDRGKYQRKPVLSGKALKLVRIVLSVGRV
jgi:hypothetical protein